MNGLEILELKSQGEYFQVRAALHGRLAVPFEFHKSVRTEQFPREADFEAYIARECESLLNAYGDARDQRPTPDAEFVV